jgi:cyclohexyl-isocyanide hydratase
MNRRRFTQIAAAVAAAGGLGKTAVSGAQVSSGQAGAVSDAEVERSMKAAMSDTHHRHIAMLLYPGMYALDLVGPYTFLSGLPNVDVHLVWKTREPVTVGKNLKMIPTATFEETPGELEAIFVPGGMPGTISMMEDAQVLDFLADRGSRARYVTSVCTGSLILGAAGLLKGYKATSHWDTRDLLPLLGAIPVDQRVVEDRNRITGGGVTSGIDFGLVLASRMTDSTFAQMLQLINEYDPQPPYRAGTPVQAGPAMTSHMRSMLLASHERARTVATAAGKRLG